MPGAPLEPGKVLKEGGGPYGLPGAVVSQTSVRVVVQAWGYHLPPYGLYAILGCTCLVTRRLAPDLGS